MLPVQKLKVLHPHMAKSGTLLLRNVQYADSAPLLVCGGDEPSHYFRLSNKKDDNRAFILWQIAVNLGAHLAVDKFEVEVNHAKVFSPFRSDIPVGSVAIISDTPYFVCRQNYGTAYVSLSGEIISDPSYDNFSAFGTWRLTVPHGDKSLTIYESDLPEPD